MSKRYSPANGIGRCRYCRELEGPDHVRHPWSQIVAWLWASHLIWRIYFVFGGAVLTLTLAAAIAAARIAVTGLLGDNA